MTDKEIEKILKVTRDILLIPFCGLSLKHKILEIKESLALNIDYFRDTDDIEEPTQTKIDKSKGGENLWVPSIPDDPKCKVHDIIPDAIVQHITEMEIKEGLIHMESGLRFHGLKGRLFNLSFEKHNRFFYSGMITEITADNSNTSSPENLSERIEIMSKGENKADKIEVIKMLIYHLVNSDTFYNYVASEYFLHWKPLFDNQLLEKFSESIAR
jgi:hypothetical protein